MRVVGIWGNGILLFLIWLKAGNFGCIFIGNLRYIIFNILWSILLKHEFVVYFDSFDEKRLYGIICKFPYDETIWFYFHQLILRSRLPCFLICRWQFTGALRMVVLVFYKLMLMRMWERQCLMPVVVNVNLTNMVYLMLVMPIYLRRMSHSIL